jgi:hypothetical protein
MMELAQDGRLVQKARSFPQGNAIELPTIYTLPVEARGFGKTMMMTIVLQDPTKGITGA